MSEAVTVPTLMVMTSTVSEESRVRDIPYIHTDRQAERERETHTHTDSGSSMLKFAVAYDFANKNWTFNIQGNN